jgi:LCP family protein required for cell wall assembly
MKIGFKISPRLIIVGVIALALIAGTFALARYLTVTMRAVGGVPGLSIVDNGTSGTPDAPGLPTAEPVVPDVALPPTWDGASRVTILLMGVDTELVIDPNGQVSPDRVGPARSDTMILLTIDPQSKTAGMMSIPRDLWVNIPGFNYARINTAYYNGEANKLPGGGPVLAMRTVEQVIGVPVQYYAQMEFWAFTRLIEDIGKVNVFVEKKIIIDPMGPGADKIMLSAGWHKLGGVEALGYVRQRHTDGGDVDRSKRQQAVILAVRQQVMDPANFPTILANAPAMYNDIQTGVKTNLTFDDIMRLGMLAKDIPPENIKTGVIDYKMVQLVDMMVDGQKQSVMKPISDKIRVLRDEIFTASGALSPMAKGTDALDLAKQEGATVAVYNGSSVAGMAQKTADYLKSLGFNVVVTDTASYQPGATQVIDHRGKLYALRYFKELFKLSAGAQIVNKYDPASAADIDIVLSDDWALSNPMP